MVSGKFHSIFAACALVMGAPLNRVVNGLRVRVVPSKLITTVEFAGTTTLMLVIAPIPRPEPATLVELIRKLLRLGEVPVKVRAVPLTDWVPPVCSCAQPIDEQYKKSVAHALSIIGNLRGWLGTPFRFVIVYVVTLPVLGL